MPNHGDPVCKCGDRIYRKRGNEVFFLPSNWEVLKKSVSLLTRLQATWKKIQYAEVPDLVMETFGLKAA